MSRELNRMRKKTIEQLDKAEKQAKDSLESLDCHIEEIQRDTERVAEIAHNAPAVIQNIEKDFKEKTKLELACKLAGNLCYRKFFLLNGKTARD